MSTAYDEVWRSANEKRRATTLHIKTWRSHIMMLPVVIAIFLAYLILQPATPLGFLAVLALACPIAFVVVKILNYCERFIKPPKQD
ncbi:hypothetical protein LVJ82_01595 [Vitreoscilla massiliensis]|uniref:Uncharacterized protein n=1 Tax=Vitreoscilla massiliensis TaxID=1689272 RepID=A0ABY4E1Q6_9NEIS|nr:hypothetical protein [Vitreoscilla massiliensis]UOO89710.1 hypothetical protein LVJ82_01595 [Vitreoscilla massiliensis]